MAAGTGSSSKGQIEVFDVHELKLGVAAFLCDLVNPFSHGLAVATRPGASNDNGNLKHTFLHCVFEFSW